MEFHSQARIGAEAKEGFAAFHENRDPLGRDECDNDSMTTATLERTSTQQIRQAEDLLFSGPRRRSVAKELFWGRFASDLVLPYPQLSDDERPQVEAALGELKAFCDAHLDPAAIDRQADIPRDVIDGLARLGVLGMTAPESLGGRGFSQLATAASWKSWVRAAVRLPSSSTPTTRSACGPCCSSDRGAEGTLAAGPGRRPEAGGLRPHRARGRLRRRQRADRREPSADGSHYVLNGQKRYITNGAIADVLTVMARTPVPGREETP